MSENPNFESGEVRDEQTPPPADAATTPQTPDEAPKTEAKSGNAPAAATLDMSVAPRLSADLSEVTIINDDFRDEDEDQADLSAEEMLELVNTYEETLTDVAEGKILRGIVVEVRENEVLLNIGFKSEGVIPLDEFGGTELISGDEFDVFLEKLENQDGLVALSKERADFLKVWDKIKVAHEDNEIVSGIVDRRIKGGLVVKLWGVDTFLPGSQVALRQVPNLEDLIGQEIECRIIKKNKRRRNVVVSRRIVLEQEREEKKKQLIAELEKGQVRRGVVKNITDFGAFVDLGGIDGLLHITDLSWGRVQHPSEVVQIGDEIDVKVLDFEQERERISLGLKQLQSYPWEDVEKKYPEESVVRGRVVSITNYGAFVELEKGVEGLIHISEMSWTRHIKHPSKVVSIGDEVNVMVLKIDKDNEKISLGLKQTEEDPWLSLAQKYPGGTIIEGKVRNLTDFGAFVDLGGIDGLLHITDLSWGRVQHPSEVVQIGDEIDIKVLDFEQERERISLGLKQLQSHPWEDVEKKYPEGAVVRGRVVSITNYGAFVELEKGVEGLIHISEMSWTRHIKHPSKVVNIGDEVNVMVLKIDKDNEKISLGLKQTEEDPWMTLTQKYPVGTLIEGKVRNLTDFGAFVEVEEGIDGLVHISDMSWTKRVRHPKEVLRKGESVAVQILDIDTQKRRISLGIKQLQENPWPNLADEFPSGREIEGNIIRMLDHGLIVDLGNDLEGFVPTGHLGLQMPKMDKPQYYFKEGETADLKVIKMDTENRRIVLSITERLEDLGADAQQAFIDAHPRLDDVAEADQAEGNKSEILPGDEDLAREAAELAGEDMAYQASEDDDPEVVIPEIEAPVEAAPVEETPAEEAPAEEAPVEEAPAVEESTDEEPEKTE